MRGGISVTMMSATLVTGCGGATADNWPAGRPRIDRLRYIQQTPGKPTELEFEVSFVDTNGDLAGGALALSINGERQAALSLDDLFAAQSPPISGDAEIGELDVLVELGSKAEIGQEIELAFQLRDHAGEQSNQPSIRLKAIATGGG